MGGYVYQPTDGENEDEGATWSAGERYKLMEGLKVTSQAMGGREIPVVTVKAKNNPETAPTIYLLNAADGGEGGANWLKQTSAVDFYGTRISVVNAVTPMAGAYSYYTDWQSPVPNLDTDNHGVSTTQMWVTFLTQELPGPMEGHLGTSSDKRAIIGISMTGSTSLIYAEKYPGFYDVVGSYSGCAATSREASQITQLILDRGDMTFDKMWGAPTARSPGTTTRCSTPGSWLTSTTSTCPRPPGCSVSTTCPPVTCSTATCSACSPR